MDPVQTCLLLEDRALVEDPCSAVDPARLCRHLDQILVGADDPCWEVGPARVAPPPEYQTPEEVEALSQAVDPCLAEDPVRVGPLLEDVDLGEAVDPYLVADHVHGGQDRAEEVAPCREVGVDPCSRVDPDVFFARTSAPDQGNQKNLGHVS